MLIVRQSTARTVTVGPVLDADGVAVTDGVVGDFKISKNGGVPATLNGSATLTHRHTGHYSLALTASDLDTVGTAEVVIDDTVNACPVKELSVVEEAVYDALYAASAAGYPASAVADAVWDEARSGHQTQGTFGQGVVISSMSTEALQQFFQDDVNAVGGDIQPGSLVSGTLEGMFLRNSGETYASAVAGSVVKEIADNASGAGGGGATVSDIWTEQVPGSYASGSAGHKLGTLGPVKVSIASPVADGGDVTLVQGDAYTARLGRALTFTDTGGTWPDLTDAVITLEIGDGRLTVTGIVVTATGSGKSVRVEPKSSETELLTSSKYDMRVVATFPGTGTTLTDGGDRATLVSATCTVVDREDE